MILNLLSLEMMPDISVQSAQQSLSTAIHAGFALLSPGRDTDTEFTVLGLVDLEAVPQEKRHLPLDGDDNPIPLVQFSNMSERKSKRRKAATTQRKKKKRVKRNKKRR